MRKIPRTHTKIETELSRLVGLDRAAFVSEWTAVNGMSPPKGCSLKFLRRSLAHEMQNRVSFSLTKQELKQLNGVQECVKIAAPKIIQGTRLVREWNGKPYVVQVIAEGFVYKGKVWKSLSAIAKDITGAHWSGPRFFGVSGVRS